jgi:hypothetical protein
MNRTETKTEIRARLAREKEINDAALALVKTALSSFPDGCRGYAGDPKRDGVTANVGFDMSLSTLRSSADYISVRWHVSDWPRVLRKWDEEKKTIAREKLATARKERGDKTNEIAAALDVAGIKYRRDGDELRINPTRVS